MTTTTPQRPHPQPGVDGPAADHLALMLSEQAASQRHGIAIVGDEETVTFGELHTRAAKIARELAGPEVHTGDAIGIYLPTGIDLVVAAWGVLYSGAGYLPLPVDYPRERLAYMVRDSGATRVITSAEYRCRLEALLPPQTTVDDLRVLSSSPPLGPQSVPWPTDLAYLIYTSGSTGKPKGVEIPNSAITSQLRWLHNHVSLGPGKRILLKTPTGFDAAQWEILANACGATVVVGEAGLYHEPAALIATLRRHRVNFLQAVPTRGEPLPLPPDLVLFG